MRQLWHGGSTPPVSTTRSRRSNMQVQVNARTGRVRFVRSINFNSYEQVDSDFGVNTARWYIARLQEAIAIAEKENVVDEFIILSA
jgi:hypothetical protein